MGGYPGLRDSEKDLPGWDVSRTYQSERCMALSRYFSPRGGLFDTCVGHLSLGIGVVDIFHSDSRHLGIQAILAQSVLRERERFAMPQILGQLRLRGSTMAVGRHFSTLLLSPAVMLLLLTCERKEEENCKPR